MSPSELIALALQAVWHTVAAMRWPRLWTPWLVLGAAQALVIACVWNFAHPALSWWMAPLLVAVAGADTLDYPVALEMLPRLYDRADVLVGALLGSVAIGAATPLFAAHFRGERPEPGAALLAAARRGATLVLVQLPFNLLVTGLVFGAGAWLGDRGGLLARAAGLGIPAALLVLQASFLYVAPLVMVEGLGPVAALRAVPGTWRRGFVPALLISLLALVLLLPLQWLSGRQDLVVSRGRPELLGWLTVVKLLGGLLNWFLLSGSAVLVYLGAVRGRGDER